MITHENYRRALLADPQNLDPELRAHREACAECALFSQRLSRFEGRLQRALQIDVSQWGEDAPRAARGAVIVPFPGRRRVPVSSRSRGWLALAASVLLAVAAGGFWLTVPGYSLAADVVTHMAEEPDAWRTTDVAVSAAALGQVLADSHVRLRPGAGMVSYAASCAFRGHRVPHLVVQTDKGAVTVMVLTHETLHREANFDEQGYRGIIVPVSGHGSLAVLGYGASADMHAVRQTAARVLAAIDYTD